MDLKEADKFFNKRNAKAFIVKQNTNDLLGKDPKTSEVLQVDEKLGANDNVLYTNYLDTISLLNKKDAAE